MGQVVRRSQQRQALLDRLREQRQRGDGRGGRLVRQDLAERRADVVGVALDDRGPRKARLQEPTEIRVEFDENEALLLDAAVHERVGDGAGARAEFDHRARLSNVHIRRHLAGEQLPGRRHRPGHQGTLDPRAQEARLVVEIDRNFFLRLPIRLRQHARFLSRSDPARAV